MKVYIQCERTVKYSKIMEMSEERFEKLRAKNESGQLHKAQTGELDSIIDGGNDWLDADDFEFLEMFECDEEGNPKGDRDSIAMF